MKENAGGGAVSVDPQWSEERGAFLAAFTERNQGKLILLLRAKCWDSSPPSSPPCPPPPPPGIPIPGCVPRYRSSQPGPLLHRASKPRMQHGCLPPPVQFPELPGLEGVKHCSTAGEAEFNPAASAASATAAALCSPLPDICPSCPKAAGHNGALCLPVRRSGAAAPTWPGFFRALRAAS